MHARSCCALWILLLAGCAHEGANSTRTEASSGPDAAFQKLSEDYLAGYLAWRPQQGTQLGLHQYDGKLTDFSRQSIDAELNRLRAFDKKLSAFDPAGLSPQRSRDYVILRNAIRRERFSFEELRAYTSNPMTYAGALDVNLYIKRDFAPLNNRAGSIVEVLRQVPQLTAAARENLEPSLPRPWLEIAIQQAEGTADFLEHDLPPALKAVSPDLRAEFSTANQAAVSAMRGFAKWLKEDRLPKANENYHLGRDRYVTLLRCGEGITTPPEKLLEIGFAEMRHQQDAFAEAARVIDPAKAPAKVFLEIQQDHPTARDLVPATARNLEAIREFVVGHRLVSIPSDARAQVREMPSFLRATGFAMMDTPGPFEASTEAYYYVAPPEPDWPPAQVNEWLTAFNYYTTDVVSIHEAYPGHYVQYLCLNASRAPRLEKILVSYAFSEGWAHYAEQMVFDSGFGASPGAATNREEKVRAAKYRLAQADEALLRVCRLCVSVQMHCRGMTIDEATRFFQENCYYEEKPARQEALRGAYDPEYLYYTLGKLAILKLRADYQKQEGARFSLLEFHNQVLSHGAPPIALLRQALLTDPRSWNQVL